jgi:hypothetical protein
MSKAQQLYDEIMIIWNNKDSYKIIEEAKLEHASDLFALTFDTIITTLKNSDKLTIDPSNETLTELMQPVKSLFEQMNIETDGLNDFFVYFMQSYIKANGKPCECFKTNTDFFAKLKQTNDSYKITILDTVAIFICNTCNLPKSAHNPCVRYSKKSVSDNKQSDSDSDDDLEKDSCTTCGLDNYEHDACMKFTYSDNENCNICNLSRYDHIKKLNKSGIKCCDTFVDDNHGYCSICMHNIQDHMYSYQYKQLNTEASRNITYKNLGLTVEVFATNDKHGKDLSEKIQQLIYNPDWKKLHSLKQEKGYK